MSDADAPDCARDAPEEDLHVIDSIDYGCGRFLSRSSNRGPDYTRVVTSSLAVRDSDFRRRRGTLLRCPVRSSAVRPVGRD